MLCCLQLSFSGKAVHRVFASGGQAAFFEGHEHTFRVLGGVPFGKIRYDNLKAAVAGADGKVGVEGQIGWFRRNQLVPVPEVESLAALNELLDGYDLADERRRIGTRPRTVGELFAIEQPLLKPVPAELFETGRWFTPL